MVTTDLQQRHTLLSYEEIVSIIRFPLVYGVTQQNQILHKLTERFITKHIIVAYMAHHICIVLLFPSS